MSSPILAAGQRPLLIGVVHLAATPGAPGFAGDFGAVLEAARRDARALAAGGLRHAIVENFGDHPFFAERVPPETVAAMALALDAVRGAAPELELGVNVLRNDVRAGLGLCASGAASFVRVNVHTGAAVTDQGVVQGRAAETMRERARLAPEIAVLADVHVKHATPMGAESLADAARETAGRGAADGLIVSGTATGAATDPADLARVRAACPGTLLLVGSGLTESSAKDLLAQADGAIVGTALKEGGDVHAPVDAARVRSLLDTVQALPARSKP